MAGKKLAPPTKCKTQHESSLSFSLLSVGRFDSSSFVGNSLDFSIIRKGLFFHGTFFALCYFFQSPRTRSFDLRAVQVYSTCRHHFILGLAKVRMQYIIVHVLWYVFRFVHTVFIYYLSCCISRLSKPTVFVCISCIPLL